MVQPPGWLKLFYPAAFWRGSASEKVVYLTFDDGPIPEVTPWVVDLLHHKGIQATFFCVGENVARYPHLLHHLLDSGHLVGNHTFHHVPAWRLSFSEYLNEIEMAQKLIHTHLFRPPHGKLWPWQMPALMRRFRKIVMWDVLTKDYDRRLSPDEVVDNVVKYVRPGSVIVFHDSLKAWPNLQEALPRSIDWLQQQGYRFKLIPS